MTRRQVLGILAIIVVFSISPIAAYAHGVGSCLTATGGCALSGRNGEQYSNNALDMNDDSSGVLTINGTTMNRYHDHELRLVPYMSVDALASNPFGSLELNNKLRSVYPLYNDPASWYFRVESDMPNPIIIKPREEVDYEIKAYPLKAGVYHVHLSFVFDYVDDGRYRYYQSAGRGQTVIVTGSNSLATGEVTQLILPFAIGAIAIPIAVLEARKAAKSERNSSDHNTIRMGIRLYFAVKASLETVWLAGLLLWFFTAAYPTFYPLESRILSMAGMIALMGAITISGYVAAIAKSSKLQTIFAIGTAIASIVFYFVLVDGSTVSFYSFIHNAPYYYSLLPTSDVGYPSGQFYINGMPLLVGLIANTAAFIMSALMMIKKHKASIILVTGIGVLLFFALGLIHIWY